MKALLATRNAGKLRELQELLPELTLIAWPHHAPELPETGAFFQDNALQKAEAAKLWWVEHKHESIDAVIADDSGLCVDALWGGPGVLTARFAQGAAQSEKNLRLLGMLEPDSPRTARFVCVLACIPRLSDPFTVSGFVEGSLAFAPSGSQGFGYDPIFIPEGFDRSFGELPSDIKHQLSHRARACEALRKRLQANP
jgi:XTP/dITP diphosphohydrolase